MRDTVAAPCANIFCHHRGRTANITHEVKCPCIGRTHKAAQKCVLGSNGIGNIYSNVLLRQNNPIKVDESVRIRIRGSPIKISSRRKTAYRRDAGTKTNTAKMQNVPEGQCIGSGFAYEMYFISVAAVQLQIYKYSLCDACRCR